MRGSKLKSAVLGAAALVAALGVAACGPGSDSDSDSDSGGDTEAAKVAFLMPDTASTRYELYDAPLFEERMAELCPDCEVLYQNADGDAQKQQQQIDSVLAQGAEVIVLDPVDAAAAATSVQRAQSQEIPVIAYDRPIPQVQADYYISYDNEAIGEKIAQSLVDKLESENVEGGILIVNGSPTDAAAGLIKDGIHKAVDPSGIEQLAEFDTPDWVPAEAQDWVSGQITQYGDEIVGVVAANDGTGGGAISAFKSAGVPVPPVTGNDSELAAAQRILSGDQYNTISKPIGVVASAAADTAYAFLQDDPPEGKTTLFDTPSELFQPTVVTKENLKRELIDSGELDPAEVCTDEYAKYCEELGIN